MTYPPHIPLKERKELCGRLLFFDAAEPLLGKFIQEGAMDAYNKFQDNLFSIFSSESNKSGNHEQLDDFLRYRIKRFENFLYVYSGTDLELAKNLLKAVEDKAAALSCRNCSHPVSIVCNGGPNDPRLVAQRGLCIEQLLKIFLAASEAAKRYCSHYGTIFTSEQPLQIYFSTQFYPSPNDIEKVPVNHIVRGLTTYNEAAQAQVQLGLIVNKFDLGAYQAVPFVLCHECVAHALHSIYPTVEGRKGKYSFDPWGEGWMDWVALCMIEDIINQKGPAADLSPKIPFQSESRSAAHKLHKAKVNPNRQGIYTPADMNKPSDTRFLFFGAQAAEKTYYLLRQIFKTNEDLRKQYQKITLPGEDEFRAAFYRLSFDLNMHKDFDNRMRARFVSLLNNLPPLNQLLTPEQLEIQRSKGEIFNKIENLLEDYLLTERVENLLQAI